MTHGRSAYVNDRCRCSICTEANSEYSRNWHGENRASHNEYLRTRQKERYHTNRTRFLLVLGNECAACGTSKDLEFDHIDPSTKEKKIAGLLGRSSEETIMEELVKCQLLCKACHRTKSNKDIGNISRRKRLNTIERPEREKK